LNALLNKEWNAEVSDTEISPPASRLVQYRPPRFKKFLWKQKPETSVATGDATCTKAGNKKI